MLYLPASTSKPTTARGGVAAGTELRGFPWHTVGFAILKCCVDKACPALSLLNKLLVMQDVNSRTRLHSPPPRMRVASCHCRTYFRHLPTPCGVMLKEHMGSPAMVSAPSCSTTASGLNAAYTSFSTLWREVMVVTANTAQRDAGGLALLSQKGRKPNPGAFLPL